MNHHLPDAVLLDLDDTILNDSGNVEQCWREACLEYTSDLNSLDPAVLLEAIDRTRGWFWSDAERHREGRLDLDAARREIVRLSLAAVGVDHPTVAGQIADRYSAQRDAGIRPFPDAVDTVRWLRDCRCRLVVGQFENR
jgi:putative hydrolase of the HAD superfamily